MISPPQVVLLFWKAIKEDGTYSKRLCQMVKKDGVQGAGGRIVVFGGRWNVLKPIASNITPETQLHERERWTLQRGISLWLEPNLL